MNFVWIDLEEELQCVILRAGEKEMNRLIELGDVWYERA